MRSLFFLSLVVAIATATSISLTLRRTPPHPNSVFGHEDHQVMKSAVESYVQNKFGELIPNFVPKNVKLGGNINPLGIYYVQVSVGTPPQSVLVAVDTGSYTFVVPGPECKGCPKAPKKYDYTKSSSYKSFGCPSSCNGCDKLGRCAWSNTYETCNLSDTTQPCTIAGFAASDVFGLGSLKSKQTTRLGVITSQTSNFQQLYVIDGILGFSLGTTFGQPAQIFQLAKEGQISKKFAMCFDKESQHGGVLTLGEPDDQLKIGDYQSTPFLPSQAYVIQMKDIKVGGKSLGLSLVPTIVDSGTNILLFPHDLFGGMKKVLLSFCSSKNLKGICNVDSQSTFFEGKCFKLSSSDVSLFPPLQFDFDNNAKMELQPSQYLLPKVGDTSSLCLGIQDSGRGGMFIIGDTTMENYYTVFDVENMVMKWAPVNKKNCVGL